jgi:hypothetical protein
MDAQPIRKQGRSQVDLWISVMINANAFPVIASAASVEFGPELSSLSALVKYNCHEM